MENNENNLLEKSEAIAYINGVLGQIMAMGANDSEKSDIEVILNQLHQDEITPAQAKAKADSILESKQAYH